MMSKFLMILMGLALCFSLQNCGRKAPIAPLPGTLVDSIRETNFTPAPVTPEVVDEEEEEDPYERPGVDEAWFETDPNDDDDDDEFEDDDE